MTTSGGCTDGLVATIGRSVIGDDAVLDGPFGPRRLVYADHTASGRALTFVEDFVRDRVLPLYANTHTESSATGLAMTRLREESRQALREMAGAGPDTAVVFCGSGSTAAIDKLIGILQLRVPADLDAQYGLSDAIPADRRPVVLVGPYEHHSNEISWRETIADVVEIPADDTGRIDLAALERTLAEHADRPLRIGSFSAASNVTGILTDTAAVAAVLHRHGALAFFDHAAAGPYTPIDMDGVPGPDGVPDPLTAKDAVFLSPHKFVGGPGTPGVLLVRRDLARNRVPVVPGGGTVAFVTPHDHAYLEDVEHREEGGTPAIVESVRAGLVARLKQAVGTDAIRAREDALVTRALQRWRANPALGILGDTGAERLAIVSFTVTAPSGRLLHHNFVVALLNDLFGIQARGGCSCAGPYGHRLLGIDDTHSHAFTDAVVSGCSGIKPGWVRVTLPYFLDDAVVDYVLEAVDLVATHGWRLLGRYRFEPGTGLWWHRSGRPRPTVGLDDLVLPADGQVHLADLPPVGEAPDLPTALLDGRRLLAEARPDDEDRLPLDGCPAAGPELQWYETGEEGAPAMTHPARPSPVTPEVAVHDELPPWRHPLVVVAHPDDESFGLGALLAAFVDRGAHPAVLCLTHGEASTLHEADAGPADLHRVRAAELAEAARILGDLPVELLDEPDGAVSRSDLETLVDQVTGSVWAHGSDGILVFDLGGVTGHPDHEAATRVGLTAGRVLGLDVLAWTLPLPVAERLRAEFGAPFVGRTEQEVDLVVRVDRERQLAAARAHPSQAVPGSVLWRRLDLLGDREHLRWLHRTGRSASPGMATTAPGPGS